MVSHRDLMQGLVSLTITFAVMGAALFLSAGALLWPHGLTFLAAFFILVLVSVAWLWRVNPEIFAARRRVTGEGTKSWDVVLISILLAGFLVTLIVAGLDGGRFHWAPAPPWAVIAGYVPLARDGRRPSTGISSRACASRPIATTMWSRQVHTLLSGTRATCPAPFSLPEWPSRSVRFGRSCLRRSLPSCSSFAPISKMRLCSANCRVTPGMRRAFAANGFQASGSGAARPRLSLIGVLRSHRCGAAYRGILVDANCTRVLQLARAIVPDISPGIGASAG